jgi:hypothetical protein
MSLCNSQAASVVTSKTVTAKIQCCSAAGPVLPCREGKQFEGSRRAGFFYGQRVGTAAAVTFRSGTCRSQ